ncbi:MAG: hypothetical protein MUF14_01905 [Hyphomonadaceae bacterium]|jgi:hypothetical protein|nr:hypothetical protein [Hyphomonadaceae bacterium]
MSIAQDRALAAYRDRLAKKGLKRFEVLARDSDRTLIKALARKLALDDAEAEATRSVLTSSIAVRDGTRGGILAALRRSPAVGSELDLTRPDEDDRAVSF